MPSGGAGNNARFSGLRIAAEAKWNANSRKSACAGQRKMQSQ